MNLKNLALTVGVAVIFPMLVHYGVCVFSPEPKWADYRTGEYFDFAHASKEEIRQHQAEQKAAQAELKAATTKFEFRLFAVAAPLGVAAILIGACLRVQAIGSGLIFGGIFSLCNGYLRYWSNLPDTLRFLSLAVGFVVLILVGYRKLGRSAE
jgi:hypothetical protein